VYNMLQIVMRPQLISLTKAIIRKAVIQSFEPRVREDTATPYLTKGYNNMMAAGGAAPPLIGAAAAAAAGDDSAAAAAAAAGGGARSGGRGAAAGGRGKGSMKSAMLAAAQGEGFTAATDQAAAAAAAASGARGRGGKRKRTSEAAEGLGLIAAAAAAAAEGMAGGIIGPLSAFAESQDAAVGCKRLVMILPAGWTWCICCAATRVRVFCRCC
jgi:hypothetical protein